MLQGCEDRTAGHVQYATLALWALLRETLRILILAPTLQGGKAADSEKR